MTQTEPAPVRPLNYHIELAPDLVRLDFTGQVRIRFFADAPVQTVELNILELAVKRCSLLEPEKKGTCPYKIQPDEETLQIELPEAISGEFEIQIDYYGEINRSMAGFYRSQYKLDGREHPIAVTQFQESDARRAFPCMDHPAYKAKFEVALTIDETLEAISNTRVRAQSPAGGGKKTVRFEETPGMSTYLLFFGVGDFKSRAGENDPRVRINWLPGMGEETAYGLEFGQKALAWCEDYFGVAYPLAKLDLIAVPDFAFGAMENWGAITFRENLLLYDPKITSADAEERICEVIAHEIVHQWFGNLVSPADWRYLWLNESFATYFGFGAVAHYHPDWQIWDEFLSAQTAPAMARDGLTDTSAIEIRGGAHVVINSSTAPIIYSKGGSILRQIEGFLGGETFQAGLNAYLNTHAYANTVSQDMWAALESASGQPVSRIMKAWVETPGHPLVVARHENERLVLHQQRFSYLPASDSAVWPIPLLIRVFDADGGSRVVTEMMDTPEKTIEIGDGTAAYKINDGQSGFYRAAYDDPDNFDALCRLVGQKKLAERDRWGLENDVYALLKAGQYSIDPYLKFLSSYRQERHPLILSALFSHLFELYLLLKGPEKEKAADLCRQWMAGTAERLGMHPAEGEPHGELRLRRQVLRLGAFLDIPEVQHMGVEAFGKLMDGKTLSPDIRQAVMQAGAWTSGEAAFDWLIRRMGEATSEQDRINLLTALGCFRETAAIEKALDYILENTPDRNKFIPVAQMSQNPNAAPLLWDWYVGNEAALSGSHPIIRERIIGAVIPTGGLDRVDVVKNHFSSLAETDPGAPVVRMATEKLEINQRLREAYAE